MMFPDEDDLEFLSDAPQAVADPSYIRLLDPNSPRKSSFGGVYRGLWDCHGELIHTDERTGHEYTEHGISTATEVDIYFRPVGANANTQRWNPDLDLD